ncbi:NADPH-dependent 7-cyano-7-deazaguanine reductase QueF [Puteibacter caeruleilacunae]|nr:NADPH-dependent 7-cyano-7-deazaguanine reductase QueF [Puteibacter caeruleilacunae]
MSKVPVEATVLGKKVPFPQQYDPSILVAVPRYENRKIYGIKEQPDIFVGFDAWHAWEVGFMTNNGLPVAGVMKIVYPSDNLFLVESKSLKLYLNSLNMARMGESVHEGIDLFCEVVRKDLTNLLKTEVQVAFFKGTQECEDALCNYEVLEELPEVEQHSFISFQENPELLSKFDDSKTIKVVSHLLRSNCKITHQPDWGSVFIYMSADNTPDKMALLEYLVSFRNENHFHEEVCEMIYKRLWDQYNPEELMVTCIYTRRGGIDICPARANKESLLSSYLGQVDFLTTKLLRQ